MLSSMPLRIACSSLQAASSTNSGSASKISTSKRSANLCRRTTFYASDFPVSVNEDWFSETEIKLNFTNSLRALSFVPANVVLLKKEVKFSKLCDEKIKSVEKFLESKKSA